MWIELYLNVRRVENISCILYKIYSTSKLGSNMTFARYIYTFNEEVKFKRKKETNLKSLFVIQMGRRTIRGFALLCFEDCH